MPTLSEKNNLQGHEAVASPSPTLAPSLQQSAELHHHSPSKNVEIILVDWDYNDPENPMNWGIGYRRFIGALVSPCWKPLSQQFR